MDTTSTILRLISVIVLVVANGFFVAAEFALVASRRTRIEAMIRRGNTKAKLVDKALDHLDRYIGATQLGITLASLGLGWIGEPALASTIEGLFSGFDEPLKGIATHAVAGTIAFAIITFLHIVFGELMPKALALLYPERTSTWVVVPLRVFSFAANPFIWALNGTANRMLRLFGLKAPGEHERVHSAEEIRMLVEQSHEAGKMRGSHERMLTGVFEFSTKNAREVMTPRTEMVALHLEDSIEVAADVIAKAGRSRYPVYRGSLDDIAGVVHAKDVLAALRSEKAVTLEQLVRPAHFVPGTREVEDVLADMKLKKAHLVIVLDEFGGTAGLVTMEDLLEEIVGQIEDEYDRPKARQGLLAATAFPGRTEIDEVNEKANLDIDAGDYTTLGGFIFGALGRLPKVGDRVRIDGGEFEVTAMDGRRVAEARFHATKAKGAPPKNV